MNRSTETDLLVWYAPWLISKRAFTLIELLSVIAVIGVLVAILIPAISHVRGSAQSTQCVSNLRHMQIANQMYASENKGAYLSAVVFDDKQDVSGAWLIDKNYFQKLTDLYQEREWGEWQNDMLCPTTKAMGSPMWNVLGANYGINYQMFAGNLGLPVNWPEENQSWAIPNYKIEKPAQTVAFADSTDWLLKAVEGYSEAGEEANGYDSSGYLAFRHNGRANVVNFDASVNSYTQEEALTAAVIQHFTASIH
ncbi:type II secretion system protein [Coraliomargarita sp. W4R53]